jgi:hypothetical protein
MPQAKKKANGKAKAKKGPRQSTLPGMEDCALAELEAKAEEYADIRDRRMNLTEAETQLNEELLALMKKHKKAEYHHGELHCWVKATDEKVKVKIGELTPKQKKSESAGVSTTAKLDAEPEPEPAEENEEAGATDGAPEFDSSEGV